MRLDEKTKRLSFVSNETGLEVFFIPAPFMMDANGVVSTAVSYDLRTASNGDSILTITADSGWMNAKDRAFPVTIDPQVQVGGSQVMNTYSWENGVLSGKAQHVVGIQTEHVAGYGVSTLCDTGCGTDSDCTADQTSTAKELHIGVAQNGCILAACDEVWYRFTTDAYTAGKPTEVVLQNAAGTALYKVAYTYTGDRVASVTEYGVQADGSFVAGPTTTYTYSIASGRTVAQTTEPADEGEANVITTVYTFADDGSLVSDYVYTEDTGRTTKVISEKPQTDEDGNKKTDDEGNVLYEPIVHVSYAYDSFDNLTHIARGDDMGYVLTYNAYHNLQSIGVEGKENGDLVTYTYKNGNGRLKAVTYANGHVMRASYNTAGQMVAEKWYENDTATQPIAHYKYVYDGQGSIALSN